MSPERNHKSDEKSKEQQYDLDWIDENRAIFWLSATTAYEELGRGALVVELISESLEQGYPFSYFAEGELEMQEDLKRNLDAYDPGREFILILQKHTGSTIYCGFRPDMGWMADLRTWTHHKTTKMNRSVDK